MATKQTGTTEKREPHHHTTTTGPQYHPMKPKINWMHLFLRFRIPRNLSVRYFAAVKTLLLQFICMIHTFRNIAWRSDVLTCEDKRSCEASQSNGGVGGWGRGKYLFWQTVNPPVPRHVGRQAVVSSHVIWPAAGGPTWARGLPRQPASGRLRSPRGAAGHLRSPPGVTCPAEVTSGHGPSRGATPALIHAHCLHTLPPHQRHLSTAPSTPHSTPALPVHTFLWFHFHPLRD